MRSALLAAGLVVFLCVTYSARSEDITQGYGEEETIEPEDNIMKLESSGSFTLNLCNKTGRKVSFALYYKYNNLVVDTDYVVAGWWEVEKNSCLKLDNWSKGDLAFYATNTKGREWGGKRKFCIEYQRFKSVYFPEYTCPPKERKGFADIVVDSDEETITVSK